MASITIRQIMSKEEEFLKEFKTLIKEFVLKVQDTTQSNSEHKRAKMLLAALENLDIPARSSHDTLHF